jgi:hypothetical protein
MRDLIVTENITLDGVIEASESWLTPPAARAMYRTSRRRFGSSATPPMRCSSGG